LSPRTLDRVAEGRIVACVKRFVTDVRAPTSFGKGERIRRPGERSLTSLESAFY